MSGNVTPAAIHGYQGGRGIPDAPQGRIAISAQFNAKLATSLMQAGLDTQTVYPARGHEVLDIVEREIVYTSKVTHSNAKKVNSMAQVLSSFNGQGAVAARLFPNNPELQTQAIMNSIRVLGAASASVNFEPGQTRSGDLAIQVSGVRSRQAVHPMAPGTPVEYYLPTIKQLESSQNILQAHTHPSKVTMELRPFDAKTAGERVLLHIRTILFDEERWKTVMNPQFRSTMSWLNTAHGFFEFSQMCGLLFLNQFGPDIIEQAQNVGVVETKDVITEKLKMTILAISQRIGILDAAVTLPDDDSYNLDTIDDSQFDDMKRRFLGSVFWDASVTELGFGHTKSTGLLQGVDPDQGRLQTSTPYGNFMHKQLNIPMQHVSGLVDAFRRQQENIAGRVTRPAAAGEMFSYLD